MKRKYELKSQQTLDTIDCLLKRGIRRMAVILRHSDRFYHEDARMEPFMGLTEPGKDYAVDLGRGLPGTLEPRLFSSHFGRCIETAYLIDKGYTSVYDRFLPHTATRDVLAPFYIKDIQQALDLMTRKGSRQFIRDWFDMAIDERIMENPEVTAETLTRFMKDRLNTVEEGQIALCVSHDWNIFPIREFKLDLPHEGAGDVGYLDGVVFYRDGSRTLALACQKDPVPV